MSATAMLHLTEEATANDESNAAIVNMSIAPMGRLAWATRHE